MKFLAYPAYKPSGIEWLGDIPMHWEVKRLKYIASANDEVLDEDTPPDWELRYVDIGSIDPVAGIVAKTPMLFEDAPSRARRLVSDGDTIVSTVRTYLKAIAPIHQPEPNLVVSTGFAVVRPLTVEPGFLAFCLRSNYFVETVVSRSTGVSYPAINSSELLTITVPLPEKSEQKAIANFLDRETGRIDHLLAKKQELIERLNERRSALISQTVNRGLPPVAIRAEGRAENQTHKPSGIEWLGDVPVDWEVIPIGRKILLQRGVDITKDEQNDGIIPVVSSGGITSFHDRSFTSGPGVIVGRKGTAGAVYYVEQDFWPHDTTLWVKAFRGNYPRYVFYKLSAMDLSSFDTGSANPTVNRNLVHPVVVSWPPRSEQYAIAHYLDAETLRIDGLIAAVEVAIERLQEYRAAIITAVVTGKIDVRKAAA